MPYIHGTKAKIMPSITQDPEQTSLACCYVGTAPINLIRGYATKDLINTPVKLTSMADVEALMGRASDYAKFTLCEAFKEHFDNPVGNAGPIYVINVLNPATHVKQAAVTKHLTFSNWRAEFASSEIILDTFAIEDKTEGTDYELSYNYSKGTVVVRMLGSADRSLSVDASYREVNVSAVDYNTVIGTQNTASGTFTGIYAVKTLYQKYNAVLSILAAPGWSQYPDVYAVMCGIVQGLNGHWNAMAYADIPLSYTQTSGGTTTTVAVDTITAAKTWKDTNDYSSEYSKIFWPMKSSGGENIHLSTAAAAVTMLTDAANGGVPFVSPSNEEIDADSQYFGASSTNKGFDDTTAADLNAVGITTLVYWAGRWVLWGPHTAAYDYDKYMSGDVDARAVFDVNMRMLEYITNDFQIEHGTQIDDPLTPDEKNNILNREKEKMDRLKAQGALIGTPEVSFNASDNSVSDMVNGDFVWSFVVTNTPPLKSATAKIAYTDAGFAAFFGEEG